MNKDEMIKDIKAIIDDRCEAELGQVHASSKGGKVRKTVSTRLIAKDIYNAGYRKVADDDEIVLKKSEYENLRLAQYNAQTTINENFLLALAKIEQAKKETAREIIDKIENLADIEIKKGGNCEKYFDMVLDLLDKELE